LDQMILVTTSVRSPRSQSGRSMCSSCMIWSQLKAICFGFGTGSLLDPGSNRQPRPRRVSFRIRESARQYKSKPKPYTIQDWNRSCPSRLHRSSRAAAAAAAAATGMAPRGPPFDFDLNEPPPEDDGASGASPARAPEPVREPSPSDLLPPLPQETLPSPQHVDSLPPPAPEPSAHDPPPPPVPESSSRDPPHLPSPVLDLEAPLSSLSTTTTTTMRRTCPRPRLYLPSACSPSPRRRRCRRPEWTRSAQFCYP